MEEKQEFSLHPIIIRIIGHIVGISARLAETPYLLFLSTGIIFSFLILLGRNDLGNRIFTFLFLAPVVGIDTALDPTFSMTGNEKEMLISIGFWLLVYNLFWGLGGWVTKKPFFTDSRVRNKSLAWLLVGVNATWFIGAVATTIRSTGDMVGLFFLIFFCTIGGLISLHVSDWMRGFSKAFILQTKKSMNEAVDGFVPKWFKRQ